MPLNISKLGKILKTLNRLEGIKEFNATLPVKIEVKKEINPIRYLIKLGNREIETKSNLPLVVGKKYFAQIKEFKSSSILSCWSMVSVKIMTLFPFSAKYNAGIK